MNKALMPDQSTVAPGEFDPVGFMMRLESDEGMSMDELVAGFQNLVDSGMILHLQGAYGATAKALIERGLVSLRKHRELH